MNDKFAFIYSARFWQMALVGVSAGLFVAYPDIAFTKFLSTAVGVWFTGSVAIGTIERVKPVTTTTSVSTSATTEAPATETVSTVVVSTPTGPSANPVPPQ